MHKDADLWRKLIGAFWEDQSKSQGSEDLPEAVIKMSVLRNSTVWFII